ncbi:MAG TPA: protein kinase [Thermoanaerobaculia bacterium]|nr:protein kinase [Thermoanaerobaculia bacterium]
MLAADTMLGPYRIVAPIGAGGMGVVYRAVDTRLGREVAVKVLSPHLTGDADATKRFEQEARAAGRLNHPNILAIYDIGVEGDSRYIVSELLEGESLRARLRAGTIHPRKATDFAQQVARGLAAAHERGIVHRDLKPENLFLTRDGLVKILDFGLVKLMSPRFPGDSNVDVDSDTMRGTPTEPGRIMGTVGYMSPEQIRGGSGDHRSDIFAFGTILYEMLSGRPAFQAESPIETLNSILKDEPVDFFDLGLRVPGALDRIVRHCLEKNANERFQSARDLAFDLGAVSGLTSQIMSGRNWPRVDMQRMATWIGFAMLAAIALLFAFAVGTRYGRRPPPSYARVTFRSGTILHARFSPDGQTILYGARFGGGPVTVYSVRSDSPESRDLGFGPSELLAVSSTGQIAIALQPRFIGYLRESGTLAQVPIAGGAAPRRILDDVEAADFAPDGRSLAVVRTIDGRCRLEYPIGKVIYSTVGWISHPRFSPKGDEIAFIDHPFINDDRGGVSVVSADGSKSRTLTEQFESVEGIAWSRDGDDVWFSAHRTTAPGRSLNAVSVRGYLRLIDTNAGWLWLHDITRDGRMLVSQQDMRAGIMANVPGDSRERDLSWHDYSVVRDLSTDGKTVLFSESGEAGGPLFGVYTRSIDGSPAIRLGDGTSESLSPDGKWVLSIPRNRKAPQIMMLPTGVGQPRQVTNDALSHRNARWFPDGKHILFQGNEPGHASRLWMQSIDGGPPLAVAPENVGGVLVTPDNTRVLGRGADRHYAFYPVGGGAPVPVPALQSNDVPIRFTPDGHSLFVSTFGKVPALLTKVNLLTGERSVHRTVQPPDPSGLINVGPIYVTADGNTVVYSYTRLLSSVYLASGE